MSVEEKTVSILTGALAELKYTQPGISLQMWYTNTGQLSFFFTNLPRRSKRPRHEETEHYEKDPPCTTTKVRETEVPPPGGGELPHLNSSSPGENPSPQSRMRGNRKKRKCTSTPELTRTADTATHTPVSFLDQEQEYSIPSVPCSNSFGPLTDLEVNESSPCPRKSVEPNPEFKCCTCQEVLSPITDKDFYDRMFDLMRRTCESESGSTSNAERRQIWK